MSGIPDLSRYDNTWYNPGRGAWVRSLWFFCGLPLLRSSIIPFAGFRRFLLQAFGAGVGTGVVIKPGVRVKYPWLLSVGDNSWIGEDAWIDNLGRVTVGHDVCISQGAYLCTGNHEWSDPAFGLIVRPIVLSEGCWIGARSMICPGVTVGKGGVAAAGSVVSSVIPPFEVHAGNPAKFLRTRHLRGVEAAAF